MFYPYLNRVNGSVLRYSQYLIIVICRPVDIPGTSLLSALKLSDRESVIRPTAAIGALLHILISIDEAIYQVCCEVPMPDEGGAHAVRCRGGCHYDCFPSCSRREADGIRAVGIRSSGREQTLQSPSAGYGWLQQGRMVVWPCRVRRE